MLWRHRKTRVNMVLCLRSPSLSSVVALRCDAVRGGEIDSEHAQQGVRMLHVVPHEVVLKFGFEKIERVLERDQRAFQVHADTFMRVDAFAVLQRVFWSISKCETIDFFLERWWNSEGRFCRTPPARGLGGGAVGSGTCHSGAAASGREQPRGGARSTSSGTGTRNVIYTVEISACRLWVACARFWRQTLSAWSISGHSAEGYVLASLWILFVAQVAVSLCAR